MINQFQIADMISVEEQQNNKVINYPGIQFGGAYTFKKKVRLQLMCSYYAGKRTGENNFVFIRQMQSNADTLPISFEQKSFTAGLHTQVAYLFGEKKIKPYLGVGFSYLFRRNKPIHYSIDGIHFSDSVTTNQNGVGINADFGIECNVHQNINIHVGASYTGIQFLRNNFVSIPSLYANISFIIPLKKSQTINAEMNNPDELFTYQYFNDSLSFWYPQPLFDVPPPANFCMNEYEGLSPRESINKLIELLNKLKEISDNATESLEDNDLANEVKAIRELAELVELLKNIDKIDSSLIVALSEFMQCNSKPLREQIESKKDITSTLILPLKILKAIVGAKMMDKSLTKAERSQLRKVFTHLSDKIKKIEEAVEKGEKIDVILKYYDTIKTDINWPSDLLKSLFKNIIDDLQNSLKDKSKDMLKKELQFILTKLIGNANAAKAVISIGKDIIDLIDAWNDVNTIKDANAKWNKGLLEIIKIAKEEKIWSDSTNCVFWNVKDSVGKVIFTSFMLCWCPNQNGKPGEGEWKEKPVELIDSKGETTKSIEIMPAGNSENVKIRIKTPPKSKRECNTDECIVFVNVEIYNEKGKLINNGSMIAGVPAD
ncbi:MAG: hypothetical protein R2807_00305 [Chitinophagales bacterium]